MMCSNSPPQKKEWINVILFFLDFSFRFVLFFFFKYTESGHFNYKNWLPARKREYSNTINVTMCLHLSGYDELSISQTLYSVISLFLGNQNSQCAPPPALLVLALWYVGSAPGGRRSRAFVSAARGGASLGFGALETVLGGFSSRNLKESSLSLDKKPVIIHIFFLAAPRKVAAAREVSMKLTDNVLRSFRVAKVFRENSDKINCFDFSSNGETVISSSDDDSIVLYDCQEGKWAQIINTYLYC